MLWENKQNTSYLKLCVIEVDTIVGIRDIDRRQVELGQARVQHGHQVVWQKLRHLTPHLLLGRQPGPQHLLLRRRRHVRLRHRYLPRQRVIHLCCDGDGVKEALKLAGGWGRDEDGGEDVLDYGEKNKSSTHDCCF